MPTHETFYRPPELAREARSLPADTYNLARLLLKHSGAQCLFVSIRSMLYLAVVDAEEIVFVDGAAGRMMELSWQSFRPQSRAALSDPVPYEAVYYSTAGRALMGRLQSEFHKALVQLEGRRPRGGPTPVVKLDGR
ncbi:MAG TPA: hypothetical protein VGA00_06740 [Acidiferrobacterales bacterium]|jgi:hypothetical protein